MNACKKILALAMIASFVVFNSCKEDDDSNDELVTKIGLPMGPDQEIQDSAVVSQGSGVLDVSYNKTRHEFRYRITWDSLTSDSIIGSHIHGTALKGANAGVVFDFTHAMPKTRSGVFTGAILVDGTILNEESLLGGLYYFNIHTNQFPEGEIRGQVEF